MCHRTGRAVSAQRAIWGQFREVWSGPDGETVLMELDMVPVDALADITGGADVGLAPDAMRQLSRLTWPGNVSQLRRVLTQTVAANDRGIISADNSARQQRQQARSGTRPGNVTGHHLPQDKRLRHRITPVALSAQTFGETGSSLTCICKLAISSAIRVLADLHPRRVHKQIGCRV